MYIVKLKHLRNGEKNGVMKGSKRRLQATLLIIENCKNYDQH
jgi:hypothetical protein